MTTQQLERPTIDLVSSYLEEFERDSAGYRLTDNALLQLFREYPHNQKMEDVLLKVAALNSLYNTNIFAVYKVAKRICELHIDPKIEQKLPELVNEIAPITIRGKTRRNYCFASKYCSWHAPDAYPIYDSFVERLIWAYQKVDRFAKFKRKDLQDYPRYKEIVQGFVHFYGLAQFSFKELDKFLWLYGKELVSPSNVTG